MGYNSVYMELLPFFFTDPKYWILINDFLGSLKHEPPWIEDHVEEEKGLSQYPETKVFVQAIP